MTDWKCVVKKLAKNIKGKLFTNGQQAIPNLHVRETYNSKRGAN